MSYAKLTKKREAKQEREERRVTEAFAMKQVVADNKRWAPVDDEDRRHLEREAKRRNEENERARKKEEKKKIFEEEEFKQAGNIKES